MAWIDTPKSKNVICVDFRAADGKLLMKYHLLPDVTYEYDGFTQELFDALLAAAEAGTLSTYIDTVVKRTAEGPRVFRRV